MTETPQRARLELWLKRIGYTIGAIIALILIIVSFVYGATVTRAPRSVHVSDGPRPVHGVFR